MRIIQYLKQINLLKFFKLEKLGKPMVYGLAITIFVVLNMLFSTVSFRFDFSYGKSNTLSSPTKKVIKKLDGLVNIKFFVSSDLPTRLLPVKNEVMDLLNEYKKENRGKINLKIIDPKKDEKALNEARELGIPELQFSQLEQDKYAVTASYFGIAIGYGDKKEIIPQATNVESLEYNLTAFVYKMTKKELEKIGIIGQEDEINTLKKVLSQQFTIDYIDVSSSSATKEINAVYKTVLVFDNNKKEYDAKETDILKNYLDKGGRAVFFADGVWVGDNLTTSEAKHNLFNLLADYGVKLNANFILSTNAELVNFGNSMVSFFVPYPFWAKTNNFDQKTSFLSNINQVAFPWTSSLTLEKKENVETKALIKTSKKSWEQKENYILDPQKVPQPNIKDLKEFVTAAYVRKSGGGELMVIASSRFVLEKYLSRNSDNLEFVLNAVNNFASDGALTGIRQRAVSFYPLPDLPENQKDLFKYTNIFLLPTLLAIFGGMRLLRRREGF